MVQKCMGLDWVNEASLFRKWLRERINRGDQNDLDSMGPAFSLGHVFSVKEDLLALSSGERL